MKDKPLRTFKLNVVQFIITGLVCLMCVDYRKEPVETSLYLVTIQLLVTHTSIGT